jgi:hypothetical protein
MQRGFMQRVCRSKKTYRTNVPVDLPIANIERARGLPFRLGASDEQVNMK